MKKFITSILVALMVVLGVSSSQKTLATNNGQVNICHATSSTTNPYVDESPNILNDGSLAGGHLNHSGPVYPATDWGDIIPPYSLGSFNYPGMNWVSAGQAIWENDCEVPDDGEEPSPSPSPCPCVSPSPRPSPSPNASPSPSPEVSPSPSPSPRTEPSPSPEPEQQVTFSASGPKCTNNFSTKLEVKVGGVGQSGIKVKFSYKSETKEATTNSDGIAGVDFEFKGNGEVTASADGYPNKTIGVQQDTDCPSGTGGGTSEVLGASTTSQGQVLGAMAETGSPIADLFNLVFGLGAGLIGAGVNVYTKKNR